MSASLAKKAHGVKNRTRSKCRQPGLLPTMVQLFITECRSIYKYVLYMGCIYA